MFKDFSKNQKLAICVFIGLCAIALSVIHARNTLAGGSDGVVLRESDDGSKVNVISSDSDPLPASNSSSGKVTFHVTGAVKIPGVYTLQSGKRIIDAITAAGGAKQDADLQSINLAAKLEDASQICVPSIQDRSNARQMRTSSMRVLTLKSDSSSESASSSNKLTNPGEGTVHINTAGEEELQRLPGVGPSTAQKIIEYRQQIGSFASPEQMLDVKGIGPKKFEKMRPFVAL